MPVLVCDGSFPIEIGRVAGFGGYGGAFGFDRIIDDVRAGLQVGDAALADAIARECPADDPYRDRLENVQRLLALRMVQYGAASDAMNAADAEQDEGA